MVTMSDTPKVTVADCDREPIHIPGYIQPHGFLLVFDLSVSHVKRHSRNLAERLPHHGDLNGQSSPAVVGHQLVHDIRNALARSAGHRPTAIFDAMTPWGERFDVAVHLSGPNVIAEFEPAAARDIGLLSLVSDLVDRLTRIHDPDLVMQQVSRQVRSLLGYDRTMVYRFEADGSGKVVSEAKRGDLESFLGQYFPASDIPRQARLLYLKNAIRVIPQVVFDPVAVVPQLDVEGDPLDLSHAHLRSVSPIHCEYLRNMGVAASMSISLVVDGTLWGMVVCHHYTPRALGMSLRTAAAMFGHVLSLHLSFLQQRQRQDISNRVRIQLNRILPQADGTDGGAILRQHISEFASLIACDGYALCFDGQLSIDGSAPSEAEIMRHVEEIAATEPGRVWHTNALRSLAPATATVPGECAGMLAVPVSQLGRNYLLFFRKEVLRTLEWAGNPDKSYATGPNGDRMTPRTSFAIWKQSVSGQSNPWSDVDIATAESMRSVLVEVFLRHNELLTEERQKGAVRQRILNEELNHRVKNILSLIKSLVNQAAADDGPTPEFVSSLKGRIQALSNAHDQVVRGEGGGRLAALIEAETSPYVNGPSTIRCTGPDIWLSARAFSVLALVLHELATNAAKYGCLSTSGGCLDIEWTFEPGADCRLRWMESGGPRVTEPTRKGFGTALLTRSIPYDLRGTSEVAYRPEGLIADLCIPERHVTEARADERPVARDEYDGPKAVSPPNRSARVMLVEDQMLIAMDVETMLHELGFDNVATASSVAEALDLIGSYAPEVAVLDVNLGDTNSVAIAEELMRRKLPFVFATGYTDSAFIPFEMKGVPMVRKPYEPRELSQALMTAIRLSDDQVGL